MADFTMYDREREFKWQIECQLSGGTNAYIDAEDIYSGRLTRQISSGEGIEVGSCYVSELDLTIVASALPSNVVSVKPYFRLLTSTEIVEGVVRKYYTPYNLGVFKIASTKRKEYGRIDLVCYDKMADLDALIAPAAYTELLASDWKPFYLLDWIATKVDVTYTFTQSGIEAMPNGTLYFKLAEETSNIKTYRDLLQYVCMLIGAYGIFDEDGHLNIKTFADTTSYSLPASFRFSESFGDVPITYSGVELTVKNVTTMFGNANNTVVRLSDNPFLYTLSTLNQTTDYATFIMLFLRNIYTEFQGLSYYAGEFEIPPDASLNVGRLLAVTGGGASNTINCFLQKIDVNFDGRMMLSCGNPNTYVTRTQNRTTSSITNLTNRIETLESAQGGGGNKVYISELAPTVEDNAIGNEGDLWYKVKRRGHFEGAVLKCVRAGKMTEPNMEFTVGQYVRVNYGKYYNNKSSCIKYVDESFAGYQGHEYISLSASGITNANPNGTTAALWGHMIDPGGTDASSLDGMQTLRLWTCNYDEERMITSNEVARGGFGRTGVGYDIKFKGKNYYIESTISIGGILTSVYYDAATSDEHMVNPAAVQAEFDSLALFEIVDWGEGTSFNYDGTIIERMTLERYVKYDGVWVTADYKAGKGIIIADGEIRINTSTSVDIIQNVTSGTQLATINDKPIYAPTVSATQTQTSGTEIATINVGDTSTPIYAPTTTVTQTLTEGTEIGEVNGTKLYAPTGGGSDVTVTPITTTGTNIANIAVNGTTYNLFAPTSGGGGGSYAHNYSTSEHIVGTWIDGSTIYEKTVEITTVTTGWNDVYYDENIYIIGYLPNASWVDTTPLYFPNFINAYKKWRKYYAAIVVTHYLVALRYFDESNSRYEFRLFIIWDRYDYNTSSANPVYLPNYTGYDYTSPTFTCYVPNIATVAERYGTYSSYDLHFASLDNVNDDYDCTNFTSSYPEIRLNNPGGGRNYTLTSGDNGMNYEDCAIYKINSDGTTTFINGGERMPLDWYTSSTVYNRTVVTENGHKFRVEIAGGNYTKLIATLQYTKTS